MDSKLLAELKRIVQEDPTLLRRNASQEVLGLLQSRMKSSSSPMGLSVPDALVTSLRENPLSKASRKAPPGKNILMNGKVTLPDPGAHRYWQVMEIPESEGAKGVVLLYARMFPHIEYNAGGNTDLYFALLPYAVRTDLGGTWMITSEPYTIGAVSVWDDGAGTTAVWSNGATTGKSQPLVVRRDDVDGKYYLTIHCQTLNYNDPVVVDYHVRCRVFRDPGDPLIKGSVQTLDVTNIGAAPEPIDPSAPSRMDMGGSVVVVPENSGISAPKTASGRLRYLDVW